MKFFGTCINKTSEPPLPITKTKKTEKGLQSLSRFMISALSIDMIFYHLLDTTMANTKYLLLAIVSATTHDFCFNGIPGSKLQHVLYRVVLTSFAARPVTSAAFDVGSRSVPFAYFDM